jgi:hypothetical protein
MVANDVYQSVAFWVSMIGPMAVSSSSWCPDDDTWASNMPTDATNRAMRTPDDGDPCRRVGVSVPRSVVVMSRVRPDGCRNPDVLWMAVDVSVTAIWMLSKPDVLPQRTRDEVSPGGRSWPTWTWPLFSPGRPLDPGGFFREKTVVKPIVRPRHGVRSLLGRPSWSDWIGSRTSGFLGYNL